MVRYDVEKKNPEWLKILLQSKFSGSCFDHRDLRKNEKKVFCVDCNRRICQHCLASSHHHRHRILKIRKYVYNDVINLHDLQKLLDCSKVQPYTVNGAKAVFLNPRPQSSRPLVNPNGGSLCKVCERNLTEPNLYCSIACKVADMAEDAKDRSQPFLLCRDSFLLPDFCNLSAGDDQDPDMKARDSSESPNSPSSGNSSESTRSSSETSSWFGLVLKPRGKSHKRKGIPRRSPVC
ncbi:protein RGF1 INDUCIBLE TRANSCRIPTION FACTOR 1 [Magnolia sinica]|uniref:protein RGF1 INDUCIBLE TRANSCRIPTION FACTOR 1 n=1 Tax=Magnolia sinica TaxID=86752 RepID=UPI00265A4410|nr:protein RGF1 INDUCIBLE TRANSCRIPTION FACTOR 1 [Magnolia sinica]